MNINETLLNKISHHSSEYGFQNYDLQDFIETEPFYKKQKNAINLIQYIMAKHGKDKFRRHFANLAQFECGIRNLKPTHRDHVVHAMFSFILGIAINENYLKSSDNCVDPFQWKLASLFHDIGYPIQVASRLLKPFTGETNEIGKTFKSHNKNVNFKIIPEGFENLTNSKNSFDLIQKRLDEWGIQIDAKKEYNRMIDSGDIDHGIISSLAVLNVIDLMYQEYNPERIYGDVRENGFNFNQENFDNDIISSCSAIYIHNLSAECFKNRIYRSKAPLAFLLRLSDCLQEWDRPSDENISGFSSNHFDIEFDGNDLIFRIDIPDNDVKDQIIEKIKNEISCLDCSDVKINPLPNPI
ncbi:MAG TPA: hypothetical protein C5S51_09205 [Methanosarcinaceae archaeon]|nr:hypothetical protein [Methanosarcinaceae archaeon]